MNSGNIPYRELYTGPGDILDLNDLAPQLPPAARSKGKIFTREVKGSYKIINICCYAWNYDTALHMHVLITHTMSYRASTARQ